MPPGIKLALDDTAYRRIEEQLDLGKEVITRRFSAGNARCHPCSRRPVA